MPPRPSTRALKALTTNTVTKRGLGILSSNPQLPSEHLAKGASSKEVSTPVNKTKTDQQHNGKRDLNTTRALWASGDTSSIDYAHMPNLAALDDHPQYEKFNVPLLQGSRYNGRGARALGEEHTETEIEKILDSDSARNIISTASAESTYPSSPSRMNEIENSEFHGLRMDHTSRTSTSPPGSNMKGIDDGSFQGTVKTIINGIIEDLSGRK